MAFMEPETYHGHIQIIRNTREGDIMCPEAYAQYRGNEDAAKAYSVEPENVETVVGWVARLSAPGYMDCTDWSGPYETEDEAIAELKEMYPDDEPPTFTVVEYSSHYAIRRDDTGEEKPMGDGADVLMVACDHKRQDDR